MPPAPRKKTGTTAKRPAAGTRRKAPAKAPNRRRSAKKGRLLLPAWRPLLLALLLLVSLGALAYLVFLHQPQPGDFPAEPSPTPSSLLDPREEDIAKTPGDSPPTAATRGPLPREALQPPAPATETPPALADDPRPRLALIIDDMGYRPEIERQMLELGLELTFSFLPFAPHRHEILTRAREQHRAILLHLPLEALDDKWNHATGLLTTRMSDEEIVTGFAAALNEIPMATGVSNHMGSRFTADRRGMQVLLAQLPRFDLYFLDSLTTSASVGAEIAADQGLPFLRRDVFIDHHREPEKIRAQIDRLLSIAEERGWAVGIGHPYPETLQILQEKEAALREQVRLVKLDKLVKLHGQP
ncbi:divergent polysaccharide deacetylase family protein [Desulfurivibrio dismutans]|uniref:divergent polysaccharide deacetylase family protein n=1 Tax=Desulfurivibrio dismutans TaxID=1398908 RepID=UPI0023DB3E8F|nr:divergent polysaccharide deacetylase family protein [Desulfurivibrio alkaliphilus]MDF1613771.1 divergent polysaccharide deacetylase family protein [Desulfurivibrio alkaliphilus]